VERPIRTRRALCASGSASSLESRREAPAAMAAAVRYLLSVVVVLVMAVSW